MSSAECVYYIIKRKFFQQKIRPNGRKIRFGRANIAPCQPIIKPRHKNSINHIRFCRFANCSSAYSPCVPVGDAHENCVFIWCMRTNVGTLAHPVGALLAKLKPTQKVGCNFGSPNRIVDRSGCYRKLSLLESLSKLECCEF